MSSTHTRHKRNFFSTQISAALLLSVLGASIVFAFASTLPSASFSSSELRFSELSEKGFQIVPASCPSSPDYPDSGSDCAPPVGGDCELSSSDYSILEGESTTLYWKASREGLSVSNMISGIGSVGLEGSQSVSPTETTTYTLTSTRNSGGLFAVCNATITVAPDPSFCRGSASPSGIESGQSSTLQWHPANYQGNSLTVTPSPDSVDCPYWRLGTCTASASPETTTTYQISGTYVYTNPQGQLAEAPYSCTATVTVCSSGQVWNGTQCVSNTPVVTGYPVSNPNQCIVGQAYTIAVNYPGGGSAQVYYMIDWGDGSAQERSPASGFVTASNTHTAPHTYALDGQKTVSVKAVTSTGQETGWTPYTFTCDGSCVEQYYCSGNTRYHRYDSGGQCVNDNLGACQWGCLSGQCLPPPESEVDIWVAPALVRPGNTTLAQWTATDVDSCTVSEDNSEIDDSWSGAEIGCGGGSCASSHQSSEITRRTKYTLTCVGLDDETYTDTATVNIVPVWIEN